MRGLSYGAAEGEDRPVSRVEGDCASICTYNVHQPCRCTPSPSDAPISREHVAIVIHGLSREPCFNGVGGGMVLTSPDGTAHFYTRCNFQRCATPRSLGVRPHNCFRTRLRRAPEFRKERATGLRGLMRALPPLLPPLSSSKKVPSRARSRYILSRSSR